MDCAVCTAKGMLTKYRIPRKCPRCKGTGQIESLKSKCGSSVTYIERDKVMETWKAGEPVCVEFYETIQGVEELVDFYITPDSGRTEKDVQEFIDNDDCKFFLDK